MDIQPEDWSFRSEENYIDDIKMERPTAEGRKFFMALRYLYQERGLSLRKSLQVLSNKGVIHEAMFFERRK